ncbi:MAG: nitroreductase family protein [Candidatus Cloacimonadaceae bacterium]|jgi:nitroreductase|nr:nitroreductase family protein [Candidatus Cloacimonadota bacterium]MDX9949993.1 nitroreductase family protein [Candidatus Syntrophosphaera sp.]NLN84983.1 nitroreductase family protein [Candidatus Cloacimonadota bacterium]
MDFMELLASRHSVRDFLPDPIPDDVLNEILEAGRLAPSAQNRQPWRYVVLRDPQHIKKLALNSGLLGLSNLFIRSAPCLIAACSDSSKGLRVNGLDYHLVDVAISVQQMVLAAWNRGVGSCWMAAYSETAVKKYLELPKSWRVIALLPFGYPADKKTLYTKALSFFPDSKNRLPLNKIVRFFGED